MSIKNIAYGIVTGILIIAFVALVTFRIEVPGRIQSSVTVTSMNVTIGNVMDPNQVSIAAQAVGSSQFSEQCNIDKGLIRGKILEAPILVSGTQKNPKVVSVVQTVFCIIKN